jgi:PDZ domain
MKRAVAAEAAKVTLSTAVLCLIAALAAALGLRTSLAADTELHTGESSAAQSSGTLSVPPDRDLEARLRDARARLERDAHEVAELSAQLGMRAMDGAMVMRTQGPNGPGAAFMVERLRRAVVGLQLDTASGTNGARVEEVSPGGPADDAGIRPGDVIVAVNGTPISGPDTARQALERLKRVAPNHSVNLRIVRDGKARRLQLTARPVFFYDVTTAGGPVPPLPPMSPDASARPGRVLAVAPFQGLPGFQAMSAETEGMVLATLTPTLGTYFGTDRGVLVIRAPRDDVFRLEDGDVIVSIGGREPRSGGHATRILSTYGPGEQLVLRIVRHRRPMTLEVTLPRSPPR